MSMTGSTVTLTNVSITNNEALGGDNSGSVTWLDDSALKAVYESGLLGLLLVAWTVALCIRQFRFAARPDPDDGRSKRVRVTRRGFEAGRVMRAAVGEVEREFVEAYGVEELERLLDLLRRLNSVLGTRPAG